MMRRLVWVVLCVAMSGSLRGERPNFVILIADDLGYGETGMMGRDDVPTPAIDALAADGVRCTSAYVTSSYCAPSRAGFMTGRYQSRFGADDNPTGKRNLSPEAGIPESETTFIKRLDDAGYRTALVGKWHCGTAPQRIPTRRGFDQFFGFLHEGHYYVPGPPYNDVLTMIRDKSLQQGTRTRTGDLIRGNYAPINEPPYDADNPLLISDESGKLNPVDVDVYLTDAITQQATKFIAQPSQDPFCLVVAYNAVHSPMQALLEDLSHLSRIEDVQRRIFAGMLIALDRSVGQIRQSLRDAGVDEQTMIVFLSDNGGPTKELTSSNGPLRDGKGSVYEGGLRVPMVWTYPGTFPAGRVEPRTVVSLDVAATALDLAGLEVPADMDGRSLAQWFNDPLAKTPHHELFWRMPRGKAAFRKGDWKIVRPKAGEPFELYHLRADVAESKNLASQYPDVMKDLVNGWLATDSMMPE
ncbi:Arylsulfatase [Crateriforma conspicua]|uniref:Arylsulfatase n=2 Tax=Planctomycetaceae TaxID=126 RepID=A0A5C6FXH4_9PLAN|nr:Arylsulfatase [Crateriforma conspicua]